MMNRLRHLPRRALLLICAALPVGALTLWSLGSRGGSPVEVPPLPAPQAPLTVYHLGHSLVGADIPHLLAQFAGSGHAYNVQRGSGTALRAHWEESEPILDFDKVNAAPIWRDPKEALSTTDYDAVIFTEMVELRDAIKYFDGARYLNRWADLARKGNPNARLYLYETWHRLDDAEGWLNRIDADLEALWLDELAARDDRATSDQPLYLIPGGQVLAAVTRAAEAGEINGLSDREALFDLLPDGTRDQIHLSPLGAYIVALTHYAVLYHRTPEGLPHRVALADGTVFKALDAETARELQSIVWRTVTLLPRTGVASAKSEAS
ncbi:hypothetical protein [Tritonibacter mobilis]|uniref:hypothetical protein n=1 Tax=Tritonibacter mobilis TaxID=379347 RepID=UPI003A5BBB4C